MSERDRQRYQAASDQARTHGQSAVVQRYGTDSTATWAVKALVPAVLVAILGYVLGGWTSAIVLGAVWLLTSVVMRGYARRLASRPGLGVLPESDRRAASAPGPVSDEGSRP